MTAARVCRVCGEDISHRDIRATLCGSRCRQVSRAKPCQRCGGPKGSNLRQGSRFCVPCQEIVDSPDHVRLLDRERNRRDRLAELAASGGKRIARRPDAPEGQKWCARCQQFLPLDSFRHDGTKLISYCIPCNQAYNHERRLVRAFDMTPERYQELLDLQDGRCAICLSRPRKRRLAVDHDHETGEVRGLLCTRCNHGILGKAHDSAQMLLRAVTYLRVPPGRTGKPVGIYALEQGDLDFELEQLPFLTDARVATHPTRDVVAITGATFAALAQAAGWAVTVSGVRLEPPPQYAIDDMALLNDLAQHLSEVPL